MQMTVNRAQLIEALEEKRAETRAAFDQTLAERRQQLNDLADDDPTVLFLRQLTGLVEAGHAVVLQLDSRTSSRAGQFGYELTMAGAQAKVEIELPKRGRYTRESLARDINTLEGKANDASAPYDAALRLLRMSSDETVGIDAGDYHGLLGATAGRKRRGWADDEACCEGD